MSTTTMFTESIHCKISWNGQIRRFALDRTEFTSLKETITRLLSLSDEFVLKYRDDESDYVTLDTQDDLMTALMLSPKLLRILVDKKAPSDLMMTDTSNCDVMSLKYRKRHQHHNELHRHGHKHPYGHKGHHKGPHPHGPHPHGPYHGPHHNHKSIEHRKLRREKKLAFINQILTDLGSNDSNLAPRTLLKKQKLLRKKQRIEACQRGECFNQRKRQGLLTPEEEQLNRTLKVQILTVKTDLAKVKARQREIKMMLQDKVGDKQLLEELAALKEQKTLLKNQKNALVDQMHI